MVEADTSAKRSRGRTTARELGLLTESAPAAKAKPARRPNGIPPQHGGGRAEHPAGSRRQRNISSCVPVLWRNATPSLSRQTRSQSPAFATWHSLLPFHEPFKVCMWCRRRSFSLDSGVFSMMRPMTFDSSPSSSPRFLTRLRSRENDGEKAALSLMA